MTHKKDHYYLDFLDLVLRFLLAMGLTGAGFPDLDAARVALALKFLALVNSAFFFTTAA